MDYNEINKYLDDIGHRGGRLNWWDNYEVNEWNKRSKFDAVLWFDQRRSCIEKSVIAEFNHRNTVGCCTCGKCNKCMFN